jgi:hypothetical protein
MPNGEESSVVLQMKFFAGMCSVRLERSSLRGGITRSHRANPVPRSGWLSSLPGDVIELHCQCPTEVALERYARRNRHEGHLDQTISPADLRASFDLSEKYGPLGIGRLVTVNTEQPVDLEAVLKGIGAST